MTGNLDFVAQWGMNWAMLQAAIDAAADGDTIVLANDVSATASDGPLRVAAGKRLTIDLAGHTIDRNLSTPTKDGYCIYVAATLDIVDSSEQQRGLITGANNSNRRQGRTHDLVGGGIVVDEGTVTLTGGTVAGNEALDGAGVQLVCSGSTFNMSGATIKDNVGHGAGAGVYVAYGSTFKMGDGSTITGNAIPASEDLLAGEEGAGIYATGTIELAGKVTIANNTAGEGRASNAYLANRYARIYVTDKLEPTAPIGVTTTSPSPIFYITDGLATRGSIDSFVAEDPDQVVAADGDEAVMRKPKTLTFSPGTEKVEGTMEVAHVAYGTAYSLPAPGFTSIAHSAFLGWSIEGRTYAVGEEYIPRGNATATALWDGTFEVSFDAGEGTGECEPVYVACGATYALPKECPFEAPVGRSFAGWKVKDKTYGPGDEVTVDGHLTATAVWDMDWAGLQEILNTGDEISVTLPHDIVAGKDDGPLKIPEDRLVSIDLAGHKLDRAAGSSSAGGLHTEASSVPTGAVFDLSDGFTDLSIYDSVGGGTITGAYRAPVFAGGGRVVYIDLTDVTVTGNEVYDGICDVSGRLTLVRSSVTGNYGTTCGGVHVGECALTVDAGSTITDNTCRGNPCNVLLEEGATIDVCGLLADRAIGVSCNVTPRSGAPVRITSGLLGCGDEGSITSDKSPYLTMVLSDDEAYLTVPVRVTIEGGEGTGSMEVDPLPEGMSYPLPDCRFRPPAGKAFDAWQLSWGDGKPGGQHEAGERVELTGDLTLTALYIDHTHVLQEVDKKDPTCIVDGWKAHWACSGCGRYFADEAGAEELDEKEVQLRATGHVPDFPVVENEIPATTEAPGSYDSVTYCTVCEREISRVHVTEDQLEPLEPDVPTVHECVAGDFVVDSETAPNCEESGSVLEVAYCAVCNKEVARRLRPIDALGHDWGDPTYVWADDLSTVTATRVCARDASHTETETAETEPYPEPIGDGAEELVTFTATFENPAFATVSREKYIGTAGDEQPDDEDDTGKTDDETKGDSDNKDNKSDKGDGSNKGGQSTPSREAWPSLPSSPYVPISSVPFGLQGDMYGGLTGIGRRIGSTMSAGDASRTNGSESTSSNTDQTSNTTTRPTTSTSSMTTPSGSAGVTSTPATGTQATQSTSGAAAATGQQSASSAQSVTQPVSATQVTGNQGAEATNATARSAASPLATTADPSPAPGLVALAGATTLGVAMLGRIRRPRRKAH